TEAGAASTARQAVVDAVETFEHALNELRRDPLSLIAHRHLYLLPDAARFHVDATRRGVFSGVFDQVFNNLLQPARVAEHEREVGRTVDRVLVLAGGIAPPLHDALKEGREQQRLTVNLQDAGLQLGKVEQVVDQFAEIIGLLVDDAQELAAGVLVPVLD